MVTGNQCNRCFNGNIVNGVCTACHYPLQTPENRNATALPLGDMLMGRYRVGDVLGSGGFGITYAAWDTQEQKRVAVKELFPSRDLSRLPDRRNVKVEEGQEEYIQHVSQCFINEANLLIKLRDQPGVVAVYNMFSWYGTLYYVMEYLDGSDLKQYLLNHGRMSWAQLAPIMGTVLQALDRLHSANLIHRDISPDNIFLTASGEARLIDFGSVRTYQGTRSFTTFMKHNFAPLEQYQSTGRQGPWTDIYALCVTAYYSLTGILPPKAPERRESDTTKPLLQLCPGLPPQVAAAIHKGMAVNLQDRYQTARQLYQALFPPQPPYPPNPFGVYNLRCVHGYHQGHVWPMTPGKQMRLGRQPYCDIQYPPNMIVISGYHCTVAVDQQGVFIVRDDGSTNGTRLDGAPLKPRVWFRAGRGSRIQLQQEEFLIQ